MKKFAIAASVLIAVLASGAAALANVTASPMPSARLSIDVDVKPVDGQAGRFMVSSVVTDLENGAVIAKPRLMVAADKPARIETGAEGKWKLEITVAADNAAHKATYEASFTREGKVVSKQRLSVNLDA